MVALTEYAVEGRILRHYKKCQRALSSGKVRLGWPLNSTNTIAMATYFRIQTVIDSGLTMDSGKDNIGCLGAANTTKTTFGQHTKISTKVFFRLAHVSQVNKRRIGMYA